MVVEGVVYRSAQPTEAELEAYVARHGIRTVLNLRGANPGEAWYEEEIAVSDRLGLDHVDYRLAATSRLDREQLADLLAILRTAEKPLLIHCRAGSDRTGLTSAIYRLMIEGADPDLAARQLSIRYGHYAIPLLSAAWPMDESWSDVLLWTGQEGS